MALILLTNDDGIEAEGLKLLEQCVKDLAECLVVAPDQERSAVSHGLTIRKPLSVAKVDPNHFTLDGTPADCVIYALTHLVPKVPDLVISGINHGANLGDDIMYSGTVAAAREASRHGVSSLAISQAYDQKPVRFRGEDFIRKLVQSLLNEPPRQPICLNVNIPVGKIKGVKITRQGCAEHFPHFNYLAGSEAVDAATPPEDPPKPEWVLDFRAVVDRYISITPLKRDQTDYTTAQSIAETIPKLYSPSLLSGIRLIGFKN